MFRDRDDRTASGCTAREFTNISVGCDTFLVTATLVTEFDIYCGNDVWRVPLAQSIYFAGVLIGAVVFGQLGDLFGRRKVLLFTISQMVTAGLVCPFVATFNGYIVTQFFIGMGQVGVFQTSFVLAIEMA